jgi:hypothetical protein
MATPFKSDVPQPDPAVAQQQADELARARRANVAATQAQLQQETLLRSRSFGIRSLLGSFGSGNSTLGLN